tara:strand:- start:637 stop:894 length:258 start_codon:yes stop_codon:yes gene_type:complete
MNKIISNLMPFILIGLLISLFIPNFLVTAIQCIVFILGWYVPYFYFLKWFPKFMKEIGLVIWTFVGVGFSIWLVQLVGEIFGVNS